MLYTIVQDANHYRSLIWDDAQITKLVGEADMEMSLFRCEFDVFMSLHCRQDVKDAIENADLEGVFFTQDLGNIFSNQFDGNIRDAN